MSNKKMNFVFFFPDEMRADALHCYGDQTVRTPHYDRLCQQGVTFDQCHVQNPVCSPSRCTMATGRYPHCEGHRSLWNLLKENEVNLFRCLKESGYDVRIYGKNDLFSKDAAPLGCDEMIVAQDTFSSPIRPVAERGEKGYYNFLYQPPEGTIQDTADYKSVERGIQFLRSHTENDKPFFLFLPLMYPHCPYTVPEPYYSLYTNHASSFSLRPPCSQKPSYHELIRTYRETDSESCHKIRAIYAGMISFTDMLLGRVLDALQECGLDNQTTVIAASDHGDYAGDYGLVEKWPSGCEDVLTHVPLIVRTPGAAVGHRVKECVALFDIMPTVLELAGIQPPEQIFAHSLVPCLYGNPGDPFRTVYCEGGYSATERQCTEGTDKPSTSWMKNSANIYYPKYLQQKKHPNSVERTVMMRNSQFKLVYRTSQENELYDLSSDPLELHNIYGDPLYENIRLKMESHLLSWYLATSDAVPLHEDARITRDIIK